MSQNIVLIGFMGSGKSSIGRILARSKNLYFVDTDILIESFEGQKIRDIFAQKGEEYFRKLEKECFDWLVLNVSNAVISTGGGMPTVIEDFKALGKCAYLKVDFDILLQRLKADEYEKRPLFADIAFAKKIFEDREPIYAQKADITIDANRDFSLVTQDACNFL